MDLSSAGLNDFTVRPLGDGEWRAEGRFTNPYDPTDVYLDLTGEAGVTFAFPVDDENLAFQVGETLIRTKAAELAGGQ